MTRAIALVSLASLLLLVLAVAPAGAQDRRGSMWDRMSRFDADGDGKITAEEFTGPARIFERFDADEDGVVTREEVESARGGGRQPRAAGRTSGRGTGWIFKRLDRDSNGKFESADLKAILEVADEDGDGALSEKEMSAFLADKAAHLRGATAPKVGEKAPGITLTALADGKRVGLEDLLAKGKPVVLVFGSFT